MEINIEFEPLECASCDFTFALPSTFVKKRRSDHQPFFCPKCKNSNYFPGKSDLEKLKEETHRLKNRLNDEISCCIAAQEQANHLEKRVYGYMGYATKLKKQIETATPPDKE